MTRRECPYYWCSRLVDIVPAPPYPGSTDIPGELIKAHLIAHPVLTGTCPASNLRYPLDADSHKHLNDQAADDGRRIPPLVVRTTPPRRQPRDAREPDGSRSLRNPGRLGREPDDPASPDWQLGGREDEESGKVRPPIKPPRPPRGVIGQEIGRHVASVDELIVMTQHVALLAGQAIGAIQEANNSLQNAIVDIGEAISSLAEMQGQSASRILQEYRRILDQASTDVTAMSQQGEEIMNALGAGQEKGAEFTARLLGD